MNLQIQEREHQLRGEGKIHEGNLGSEGKTSDKQNEGYEEGWKTGDR